MENSDTVTEGDIELQKTNQIVTCKYGQTEIICPNYQIIDGRGVCVEGSDEITQNSKHSIRLIKQAIDLGWLTAYGETANKVHVRSCAHAYTRSPDALKKPWPAYIAEHPNWKLEGSDKWNRTPVDGEDQGVFRDQKHLTIQAYFSSSNPIGRETPAHIYLREDNNHIDISDADVDTDPDRHPFPKPTFGRNLTKPGDDGKKGFFSKTSS